MTDQPWFKWLSDLLGQPTNPDWEMWVVNVFVPVVALTAVIVILLVIFWPRYKPDKENEERRKRYDSVITNSFRGADRSGAVQQPCQKLGDRTNKVIVAPAKKSRVRKVINTTTGATEPTAEPKPDNDQRTDTGIDQTWL